VIPSAGVVSLSAVEGAEVTVTATGAGKAYVIASNGSASDTVARITVDSSGVIARVKASDFVIFPCCIMNAQSGFSVSAPDRILGEDGLFPGGPWGDMKGGDDMMRDLFECGFNTTALAEPFYIKYAIPYDLAFLLVDLPLWKASQLEFNENITPQEARNVIRSTLEKIPPELRKSIYAFSIHDEPPASRFPALKIWSDAVEEEGYVPYINMLPNYGQYPQQYGAPDYETYLNEYMRICQPPFLSVDVYALNEKTELDENSMYTNLSAMRKTALNNNIPFWNIVTGGHLSYNSPYPSPEMYSIQIYSTLAYGGRGIGYFTYYEYSWPWCDGAVCDTRVPVIDGRRTESWNFMRDVNMQIHALAPVYCTLKSVNVVHAGNVPKDGQGIASSLYLKSASAGNLIVGEFVDPDENPYLMVVNKDLRNSVQVNLSLRQEGTLVHYRPDGQGWDFFTGEQTVLAPGAGALLKIEY
jgi:hypothetical protein